MADFPHVARPCAECPWRLDVAPGRFPPERFAALAPTSYDRAFRIFACHKGPQGAPFACAGFLLRGATHNLSVRLAARKAFDWSVVSDGGHALFPNYRAMAVANGVAEDNPALEACR